MAAGLLSLDGPQLHRFQCRDSDPMGLSLGANVAKQRVQAGCSTRS
ncbi:hypothetical protein [Actinomadura alba]